MKYIVLCNSGECLKRIGCPMHEITGSEITPDTHVIASDLSDGCKDFVMAKGFLVVSK